MRLFVGVTRWYVAYIGEAGGGMFNHVDKHETAAWQAQVVGGKRWHLCSPDQGHLMYGRGGVDVFDPDYASSPLFASADCFDDTVQAGEMVFYPGGWWHATQTLGADAGGKKGGQDRDDAAAGGRYSVSLSALIVDEHNWGAVSGTFGEECEWGLSASNSSGFPAELCRRLVGRCLPFLKERFGSGTSTSTSSAENATTAAAV